VSAASAPVRAEPAAVTEPAAEVTKPEQRAAKPAAAAGRTGRKKKIAIALGAAAALALGITLILTLFRGSPGGAAVFSVDLDGQVKVGTPINFSGGVSLPNELQWLAVQTACIGIYNNAQAGNYTLGDPTDYYKPGDIREHLTGRSGAETKTDMFYGICFNYAQAAYDDITRYKSHYAGLGVKEWYIAGVLDDPNQILLYDPVSRNQATMTMNGVYVKEAARRKVRAHGNSTYHAWLWVYGNDGEVYWIDPTWTDNTGYPWWGVVRDGEELQLNPLQSLCVVTVNPADESFAWNNRGNANKNQSEYDQAIEDYTQALERNPKDAVAWNNRGVAYDNKRMYDRAREDYTQALRLDPNYATAYNNRGGAYNDKGMYDRAIEDLNEAIRLNPNYALAWINRGYAYNKKGMHDRAIEDLNQAIRLNPNYAITYNNRGGVYGEKGMYDRAIEDYNQAIRLDPNYAVAYNNRAFAYANKGMYDRAIEDYNQVLRLDPNNTSARKNIEAVRRARGW
jgi:Flp pilus assembly protein TadD